MNRPDFISSSDWDLVLSYCVQYNVNPYLIAAIGFHETRWGELGWGRYGFVLGVGCFSETYADYNFQGLNKQVEWAVVNLSNYVAFVPTEAELVKFAKDIWRPGNPVAWGKAVYKYFIEFFTKYEGVIDYYRRIPDWARESILYFYKLGVLKNPWGDYNFYRIIVILYNIINKKNIF